MTTEAGVDVTDATFASEVLERSSDLPVVVDFWAPWCGPCRIIGPILEQLALEYAGRVRLVKVDVDQNPQVSASFSIQSIPAVIAFRNGKPAARFVGAVPEPQARAFFESLLPTEADEQAVEGVRAAAGGDPEAATGHFEAALVLDDRHQAASVGLAGVLLESGDLDRAERLLSRWPGDPSVKQLLGQIHLRRAAEGADRSELEARLATNDGDAAAHYALGSLLAAGGEWEPALDHLLDAVRLDRTLDDDGPRRRVLEVLDILGEDHPLTRESRQRLGTLLF